LSGAISSVSIEGAAVGFSGLVAAIIGGLTSPGGAIIGAMLLAVGENTISLFFDVRYSVVVPVGLLVALLAVRPYGLSARIERIART
jgi:branched-chain amino acid transport system permease protein